MSFLNVLLLKLKLIVFDKKSIVYLVVFMILGGVGNLDAVGIYMIFFVVVANEIISTKTKLFKFMTLMPASKKKIVLADFVIYLVCIGIYLGINFLINKNLRLDVLNASFAVLIFALGMAIKYVSYRGFTIYNLLALILAFLGTHSNMKELIGLNINGILLLAIGIVLNIGSYIISSRSYKNMKFLK